MLKNAKWIWIDKEEQPDEYVSFKAEFYSETTEAVLFIASESDHIAYLNGKRITIDAFPNYIDRKYVDETDISGIIKKGKNEFIVEVRYEGVYSSRRIVDKAGVIFSIESGDKVLLSSDENIIGGLSGKYQQHIKRYITGQLGLSVNMKSEVETVYGKCREAFLSYNFYPRPVKKLVEKSVVYGKRLQVNDKILFDFGRETNGYALCEFDCEKDQTVKMCYGEHIVDGGVRAKIGGRDFSFDFECKKGKNKFEQLFVRMAGRYVEILATEGVNNVKVGIIPTEYPVTEKEGFLSGIDAKIYETCVRTLKLCMTEHYEDCPWREQCLYILDSRNQMLCGYYAFNETEFQRANLEFISHGKREDGLLELTFPCVGTPAIPFFSVMYPVAVYEYVENTGDTSILKEVMPVIRGIVERFISFIDNTGLIVNPAAPYWNFYEWSDGSHHEEELCGHRKPDVNHELIINCAFVYMIERYKKLCEFIGEKYDFNVSGIKKAVKENLFDEKDGLFRFGIGNDLKTELGNAFALLIGLGDKRTVKALKGGAGLVGATLSTKGFVYDALIKNDENAAEFVLNDIRTKYGYMLEQGATSFWETEKGQADFDGAGSLCHGWSAMPVYYYNLLKDKI